jgi:hypothetical protein
MTLSYFMFSAKADSVGVLQNLFPTFTAIYSLYHRHQAPRPGTTRRHGRGSTRATIEFDAEITRHRN